LLGNKADNGSVDHILDLFEELQKLELQLRLNTNQNFRSVKMRLLNYSLTCDKNIKDRI